MKETNENAGIIGPYFEDCEYRTSDDSCSYDFMIKNYNNNRIFSGSVGYNSGDGEVTNVLKQDIGWLLFVNYDHIIE